MADGSERRVARRFTMSLPLRVLPREARSSELRTQTRDVSYQGLYFLAEAEFEVGSEIEFVLTLPKQIAQSTEVDIRCRGQIVRVDANADGHVGVAAKIDRYEFIPAAASAAWPRATFAALLPIRRFLKPPFARYNIQSL